MKIRDVIQNIGRRSLIAFLLVVLLAFAATSLGGTLFYRSTKGGILEKGELNALQAAKEFDRYLLVRKNALVLAASVVDDKLRNGVSTEAVLDYLSLETQSIRHSIDPESNGLYGWIQNTYLDGGGWVPEADYVPTERPWYTEALSEGSAVCFVKPYLDVQTMTVMMTMSALLSDGASVLAMDVSLNRIQEITEEIARKTTGSQGFVLDRNGQVIAHSDEAELGKNYLEETGTLGAALAEQVLREDRTQFELNFSGQDYVVYVQPIEGGWRCVSLVDTALFFRPLQMILFSMLFLTLLEALVMLAVFYHLSAKNLAIAVQNVQIGAVADMYVFIYDIELAADTIRVIRRKGGGSQAVEAKRRGVQSALDALVANGVDEMSRPVLRPFVDVSTLAARLEGTDTLTEEYLDASRKWCRARFVVAQRDSRGEAIRALLMVESIDEEKRRRDNLKTLSETDQMTGLNNRAAGERKIRALVNGGTGGMFVLLDIDKFKSVNDRFGHVLGDRVIIMVANAMTAAFRNTDILMRLGGDEFVAYAPGVLTEETGSCIIRRLFGIVDESHIEGLEDRVQISVGAAFCQHDEILPFGELYKRADRCCYESKKTIGNAVSFDRSR